MHDQVTRTTLCIPTETVTNKPITEFCDSSNYPMKGPLMLSLYWETGSPKDVHLREGNAKQIPLPSFPSLVSFVATQCASVYFFIKFDRYLN